MNNFLVIINFSSFIVLSLILIASPLSNLLASLLEISNLDKIIRSIILICLLISFFSILIEGRLDPREFPENISFAKAYPNPFNARTRVDYVLNSGIGEITTSVKVFNVKGKLIEEILLNKSIPGLNTFFWEPKNITSGVYIFELLTGNQKNILKVLLLK